MKFSPSFVSVFIIALLLVQFNAASSMVSREKIFDKFSSITAPTFSLVMKRDPNDLTSVVPDGNVVWSPSFMLGEKVRAKPTINYSTKFDKSNLVTNLVPDKAAISLTSDVYEDWTLSAVPEVNLKAKVSTLGLSLTSKVNRAFLSVKMHSNYPETKLFKSVSGSKGFTLPPNIGRKASFSVCGSYDVDDGPSGTANCVCATEKTSAQLKVNTDEPKFSVTHQVDERNTISPEISLFSGKIIYNWSSTLNSGSIYATVDPSKDIAIKWTDKGECGNWITNFRMPLEGAKGGIHFADIKVQRTFNF